MGRRFSDHDLEVQAFYAVPLTFDDRYEVGTIVVPTFASPVDGLGPGTIKEISQDRKTAVVEFECGTRTVEPWDVLL